MCGLFGYMVGSKRNGNADDFMSQGFVASSLRGMDSSGLAQVSMAGKSPTYKYQKLPVAGTHFVTDKYARSLLLKSPTVGTLSMGHTRAATSGTIGISEAHPFFVEEEAANGAVRELVGCHNGTLTNWDSKPNARHYTVDSEWALNRIFDAGMDAFKEFTGAFCFVWWDSKEATTLNVALNDQRDLYVAFTEDDGLAYASEGGMLYWLLERNRVKLKGDMIKLAAGHRYKFEVGKLSEFTKEVLPTPPPPVITTYPNNVSYTRYSVSHMDSVAALLLLIKTPVDTTKVLNVKPEEIIIAKNRHLMGRKAAFIPMLLDSNSGELMGTAILPNGMEFEAIIRNAAKLDIDKAENWVVNLIGLDDTGIVPTAICSLPFVEEQMEILH